MILKQFFRFSELSSGKEK